MRLPTAIAPTVGRVRSNVFIAACPPAEAPDLTRAMPRFELLAAAEIRILGQPDIVEHHLGGMRGADPVLLEFLSLRRPSVPGGMTKEACPRVPSSG